MQRFFFGVLSAYLVPLVVFLGVFFAAPKLYAWHEIYSSIPAFATRMRMRPAALRGDFETAVIFLGRQADIAEFLGLNPYMRRELVESSRWVFNRARYREHYVTMVPWLERLRTLVEDNILVQLDLAEVRSAADPTDPTAPKALIQLLDQLPALDRPYRTLLQQALREGRDDDVTVLCARYSAAQAGAVEPGAFVDATYAGQGMGNFFLEVDDGAGGTLALPHAGFVLGEVRDYAFDSAGLLAQEVLRIHLPSLPGLVMRLESVAFSGSFGERRYTLDELRLHSRHGYFTAANSVLIGSWRGDVVSVMPRRETFPAGDRVELRLTFSRPALVNHEACR